MKNKKTLLTAVIVAVSFFLIGGGATYIVFRFYPDIFSSSVTKLIKDVTVTDEGIADSVEKVYDTVVVVSTYKDNQLTSSGTGFVYKTDDKKGYILTNNHVIDGGDKVTVTFTSGNVIETEIIGADELSDIAVLAVSKGDIISVAEIGSSEDLRVGDTAFAVGAPIDSVYSWTVTRGIISGKDRMVEVEISDTSGDYVMKAIQTDAAINSGNSGGPLCNANGEVIGITSLKLVSESVEGMGFAIPIEIATSYAEKIINGETITQPYLGVSMLNVVDGYYYRQFYTMLANNNITSGVIVINVADKSPASKAGLKSNDVIIKINDKNVSSIGYLRYYLYSYTSGDEVTLTVIRDGKEKEIKVTLGSQETVY